MTQAHPVGRREVLIGAAGSLALLSSRDARAAAALRAPVRLGEASLTDVRSGRTVRLVRDIMRDRVVALNFFFTGCSTTCPIQTMALARSQKLLGAMLGPRAALISISIDWLGDTPDRIRRFAGAHAAGPAWYFLKGGPESIDPIRDGFNMFDPRRDEHPAVIAIGTARSTQWSRLYGLPPAEAVAGEMRRWLA